MRCVKVRDPSMRCNSLVKTRCGALTWCEVKPACSSFVCSRHCSSVTRERCLVGCVRCVRCVCAFDAIRCVRFKAFLDVTRDACLSSNLWFVFLIWCFNVSQRGASKLTTLTTSLETKIAEEFPFPRECVSDAFFLQEIRVRVTDDVFLLLSSDPRFLLENGVFKTRCSQDRMILDFEFEDFSGLLFPRECVSVSQPTCWSLRLTWLFQPPGVWIFLFLWNPDVQQCNQCFPPENFTWLRRFDAILALKKRERWSERAAASRDFLTGFIVIRRVSSGFGPFSSFLSSSWTILSRWSRDCRHFSH